MRRTYHRSALLSVCALFLSAGDCIKPKDDVTSAATSSGGGVTRTLTVSLLGLGPGKVTGAGIDCPEDCTETYSGVVAVVLTATPTQENSSFFDWGGACPSTGAGRLSAANTGSCTLEMDADKTVTATFTGGLLLDGGLQ